MSAPITITLGGRAFAVRPLTIGQFREIYPAVFKGAGLASEEGYDQAIRCIAGALRAVREEMVRAGLARTTINARVHKIRRVFKWASGVELVPVAVYQALLTVEIRFHRTLDIQEVETAIGRIKKHIREKEPAVEKIFIDPEPFPRRRHEERVVA